MDLEGLSPPPQTLVYCTNKWAVAHAKEVREKLSGERVMFRNKQFYYGETEDCTRVILVGTTLTDHDLEAIYKAKGVDVQLMEDDQASEEAKPSDDPAQAAVNKKLAEDAAKAKAEQEQKDLEAMSSEDLDAALLVPNVTDKRKAALVAEKNRRTEAAAGSSSDEAASDDKGKQTGKGTGTRATGTKTK